MSSDLLAPSGKTASFLTVGTVHKGIVLDRIQRQQTDMDGKPQFWDNGDAKMEVVITLQTDTRDDPTDDGIRKLYVKGKMLTAVREAVAKAKAPTVEIGGTLAVKYEADGEPSKAGFNPPKLYVAQYKRPENGPDMLGVDTAPAAPAPAPEPAHTADDLI